MTEGECSVCGDEVEAGDERECAMSETDDRGRIVHHAWCRPSCDFCVEETRRW